VAVGAFVVGLVCAAATSFRGYLSAMTNVYGLEQSARATIIRYATTFKQPFRRQSTLMRRFWLLVQWNCAGPPSALALAA